MLDVNKLEYVHLKSQEITDEFYQLTNGIGGGLMAVWLRDERADMQAIAIKHDSQFIGWAACVKEEQGFYSLGVFIAPVHREQGLGKLVLTLLLEFIRAEDAQAWCKSGCSLFNQFNGTYERLIAECGLKHAHIFQSNEFIKQAA